MSQPTSHQPFVPDPHHHPVPVHRQPWQNELAPDARFIRIMSPVVAHDTVRSPDGRWCAFIHARSDEEGDRLYLQEVQFGNQYEVYGIPLPYRPLSDLVWLDDHLLAFDKWSQPHHGVHYVVDVQRLRLVLSTPFPDEFILREQGTKKDTLRQHR
jgi:hypothetical protein